MREVELLSLAEKLIDEYMLLLHVDPYFKINIEITDLTKISDCIETEAPATWKLRINPSQHVDEIDVQMSVVNSMLVILFRDIQSSKKLDEVRSKLTHAFVQLAAPSDDEGDLAQAED